MGARLPCDARPLAECLGKLWREHVTVGPRKYAIEALRRTRVTRHLANGKIGVTVDGTHHPGQVHEGRSGERLAIECSRKRVGPHAVVAHHGGWVGLDVRRNGIGEQHMAVTHLHVHVGTVKAHVLAAMAERVGDDAQHVSFGETLVDGLLLRLLGRLLRLRLLLLLLLNLGGTERVVDRLLSMCEVPGRTTTAGDKRQDHRGYDGGVNGFALPLCHMAVRTTRRLLGVKAIDEGVVIGTGQMLDGHALHVLGIPVGESIASRLIIKQQRVKLARDHVYGIRFAGTGARQRLVVGVVIHGRPSLSQASQRCDKSHHSPCPRCCYLGAGGVIEHARQFSNLSVLSITPNCRLCELAAYTSCDAKCMHVRGVAADSAQ